MQRLELFPHPISAAPARIRLRVEIGRVENDRLSLCYLVSGETDDIRLPARMTPARSDNLWKRTCFEAFVGVAGAGRYYEFNFSPSGAWAAYRFDAYRQGMAVAETIGDPGIEFTEGQSFLRLCATVRLAELSLPGDAAPLRIGLSAIIEEKAGAIAYWALAHLPGPPDFHHRDCFLLELTREARP